MLRLLRVGSLFTGVSERGIRTVSLWICKPSVFVHHWAASAVYTVLCGPPPPKKKEKTLCLATLSFNWNVEVEMTVIQCSLHKVTASRLQCGM